MVYILVMIQEQGYKDRIEQECVTLGIAPADRSRVVNDIFEHIYFLPNIQDGSLAVDSSFFDFAQKIQEASSLLNIGQGSYLSAALKKPPLFYQSPETINANIEGAVQLLGVDKKKYVHAALKQPSLFCFKPETINANIEGAAALLGIDKDKYVQAALKQPPLFYQSPETINANIEVAATILGVDKDKYVQAALKQPQLFCQSPETINANIEEAAQLLGIDKDKYVQAALKQPPLFYQSPETINANIEEAAALLGIDKAPYVQAALKQPPLFCQSPETIGRHGFIIQGLYSDGCLKSSLKEVIVGFPTALSFADDNLNMRRIYAEKQELKHASIGAVLRVSKSKVKDCLIRVHGIHPDDLQAMLNKLKADQKPAYQAYVQQFKP